MKENLRILFVTSEHPDFLYNGLGTFTRDYVCELKKYCDVFCVYFHLSGGIKPLPNEIVDLVLEPKVVFNTFTSDAKSLEVASSLRASLNSVIDNFKPDVIHCNDKQTYLPFRFDKNVFYSSANPFRGQLMCFLFIAFNAFGKFYKIWFKRFLFL